MKSESVNWKQWNTSWAITHSSVFALFFCPSGEMRIRQDTMGMPQLPFASTGRASPRSLVPSPLVSSSAVVKTSMTGAGTPIPG